MGEKSFRWRGPFYLSRSFTCTTTERKELKNLKKGKFKLNRSPINTNGNKIWHIYFVAPMLFPQHDLKAHEHTLVGRMTPRLGKWDYLKVKSALVLHPISAPT